MKKGLWMFVTLIFLFLFLSSLVSASFIRGDANQDTRVDLSDSIYLNNYLFKGGEKPRCMDAGDVNDDGEIDLSDGIYLNNYLFLGSGKAPPSPYPEPGIDPTQDDLHCGIEDPEFLAAPLESRFGYMNYTIDSFAGLYNTFYGIEAVPGDRTSFSIFYRRCRQECNGPFICWWVCDLYTCLKYVNEGGYPLELRKENCKGTEYWRENPLEIDIDQDGDLDRVDVRVDDVQEVDVYDKRGIFNVTVSLYGDLCANRIQDGDETGIDCGGRCGKCGRKPVIVIPGLMGSFLWKGRLMLDPIFNTYDDLLSALQEAGYRENETLFAFPYDWTLSNRENALKLREKIREVKNLTDFGKVDLVAHSMGGLVARYYVENRSYEGDVDKLIMLGTPNGGATMAPLLVKRGVAGSGIGNAGYNFLLALFAARLGYTNVSAFAQSVASLRELFPVFDYLRNDSVLLPYPWGYERSIFLEALNKNASLDLLSRVNISLIVGDLGENTTVDLLDLPQYFDVLGRGDGTVPLRSNDFMRSFFYVINTSQRHRSLPTESQQKVIELLMGNATTRFIKNNTFFKWLFVTIHSPVDVFIISPSGKRIGFNGSDEVNEMDLGFYSREDEIFVIPHPEEGAYRMEVMGTGDGDYKVDVGFVDDDRNQIVETEVKDTIKIGELHHYRVGLNMSRNELQVTQTPKAAPDLVITNFAVQYPTATLPRAGQNITMAFTLRNSGTANATGVFWKLDTGSVDADPVNIRGLDISVNRSVTVFTRIRYAAPGNYTARIIADYQNSIEELNEGNNERSRNIMVV